MAREKKLSIRLQATGGDKLRREFGRLGQEGTAAFNRISGATKPASSGIRAVDASARALNGVFRQAAGLIGAYAGIQGISRTLGFIVSTNREFEKLNASLKTVTGSAEAADRAFKLIEDFASETPFNVEQITEAFIKLKALGLDPSEDALRSYGNTASAMGKNLMQFVEAIADAATGEFERLKEFGIKAKSQGDQVSFTFQGITTTIGKNAEEIEAYLRRIGNAQFAGAMSEQMKTLGGVFSNIQDNFARLAREVGAGGLNDAIRDVALSLKDVTDSGREAARSLGETLGAALRVAADGLGLLITHMDVVVESLGALLIARTVGGAITAMNVAILGNAGAVVGFKMLAQVSSLAAARMVIMEGAAKLATLAMAGLRSVMLLVGGPVGIAILAGVALYKLAEGHDAAGKAAKDHAKEMEELRAKISQTTDDIESLNAASRHEALARWTEKLGIANDNVKAVTQQLKSGGIGGFWDQFSRFGTQLQADLYQIRKAFQTGRIDADQYREAIWKLAVRYPEFTENAKEIQEQVLALKAAELAASRARAEIERIRTGVTTPENGVSPTVTNPTGAVGQTGRVKPPKEDKQTKRIQDYIAELEQEEVALRRLMLARQEGGAALQDALLLEAQEQELRRLGIDLTAKAGSAEAAYAEKIRALIASRMSLAKVEDEQEERNRRHIETVEEITKAYAALGSETEQAIQSAIRWRKEALEGLDATKEGYAGFKAQIEEIFSHMMADARERDLQNSIHWADGVKRGLQSVMLEAEDMALMTEDITRKAFQGIEDGIVQMVTTGKISFSSLVDSIMADITRMAVRQAIMAPLAGMMGGMFGGGAGFFGMFHEGGMIGGSAPMKLAPVGAFDGAPRFHTGGIAGGGLLPDEVPIIARRGELVIPPERIKREPMNAAPVTVVMNIKTNDAGSFRASQNQIAADAARAIERANRNR
ncbi:phage tail tape measure C-terminal domain-containing protein [Pseudemcibacter aquimaris]|uniref:phage tail tape measure C-terminal domain-containing protein n=1 Tax=Pseudemcibacter aquimaris TaxID=2857064 RepID=UPI00201136A6|nr:phage tail tape measure C-terminal domain-containing protein [Pseudemcibacter aquimaris]MCC3862597.1 tape measure protein [Pseudemcibacter aquimaris]WDU57857.1 hypothetical protein KW060_11680 [Pseudemcibacter aquimaris]